MFFKVKNVQNVENIKIGAVCLTCPYLNVKLINTTRVIIDLSRVNSILS